MRPNLFQFASSELSQDAMLCWLATWGDPASEVHDKSLHHLGRAFLQALFAKHGRQIPTTIKSVEIRRQYKNIDVLLVINGTIAVCIEDKVGSVEHSDQLQRYVYGLTEDGFSEEQIIPVYVQTGEQGHYRGVRAAGYAIMRRRELIELFLQYISSGGANSIAHDFYEYLTNIDRRVDSFRINLLSTWNVYAWQGFYSELQRVLGEGEWSYVPNPSGGFVGFWWHWRSDVESGPYLQLEQGSLCFKISVDDATKRADERAKWSTRVLKAASYHNLQVVKPQRLGMGQTMTVAVLKEYRCVNNDGLLDIDATVGVLRSAAEILDRAIANGSN